MNLTTILYQLSCSVLPSIHFITTFPNIANLHLDPMGPPDNNDHNLTNFGVLKGEYYSLGEI